MRNNILFLIIAALILFGGIFYLQKEKSGSDDQNPVLSASDNLNTENSPATAKDRTEQTLTEVESQTPAEKPVQTPVTGLSEDGLQKREELTSALLALLNCPATHDCPRDDSEPRAGSILLGQMLAEKLREYLTLHQKENYFDQESLTMVQTFIDYPDGHVQEEAINLMSSQKPDTDTAMALIDALADGFDAKIMSQAMQELQRYPYLEAEIDALLQQSLQTGSFYVAQEIATNILPFLNTANIDSYIAVADKLPPRSKRARFLRANIKEFQLHQTGG